MFESYYQLTENPFRLSADESYRFAHKNYLKAWSHLSYSLEQGEGFVMITGIPGSGKTTLIRDILAKLDKSKVLAINLVTNQLQAEELLRKVALEFGLPAESFNKATLLTRIQDHVEKEYQEGRRAVIVIDEAQNLTLNGLEELRLLSNLQSGSHPLFQIILVGQDELRGVILSPEMEHIRQRLIATCNIEPMNAEQTEGYIEHRLGIVGWNGDPAFDPAVFPLVHYLTGGVPRKINHVVGRLLLYGALEEIHDFTLDDVWIVAKELFDEERLSLKDGQSFEAYRDAYSQSESPDESPEGSLASAGITPSTPPQVTAPISSDIPEDSISKEDSSWDDFGEYHEEDSAAAFPASKIHLDEDEAAQLTSRIKEGQPATEEWNNAATEVFSRPGTAAGEEDVTVRNKQNLEGFNSDTTRQTEEILNLPTMRAEKRKHDIETQGGLLNTSETLEEPESVC
jgi:type II secretory pathway predicted ATPase ExeA